MFLHSRRNHELKDILPRIDGNVQALLRHGDGTPGEVEWILENVQDIQDTLHQRDLAGRYPQVHEVVSFLYLSCFSLLYMEGESFHTYQKEVKRRYKNLLRSLYFFPKYPARTGRQISNL
ncbi:hypothetical protein [Salinithrix halophila]|uniref:ApeA N-terminal domain-containing protein n=1 Tax=Salinithrix halophila TaxID=1485204 RepID=A0ABV8JHR7_9BACL